MRALWMDVASPGEQRRNAEVRIGAAPCGCGCGCGASLTDEGRRTSYNATYDQRDRNLASFAPTTRAAYAS